jgi:hypothetical protein
MGNEGERWNERFGSWSTASHGRRITTLAVMLVLCIGVSAWLFADPSDAMSGPRGFGSVLAPIGVLLCVFGLVREVRTGDSRDRPPLRGEARE